METFRGSIDWVDALTAYSKKTRFGLARNRIHSAFSVRLCAPNIPKAPSLPEGPVPTRRTCPYPKDLSLPEGPVPTRRVCPYPEGSAPTPKAPSLPRRVCPYPEGSVPTPKAPSLPRRVCPLPRRVCPYPEGPVPTRRACPYPKGRSLPEGPVPTRRACSPTPKGLSLAEGPVPSRRVCPYPKGLFTTAPKITRVAGWRCWKGKGDPRRTDMKDPRSLALWFNSLTCD
jgi:hypothetical protein